MSIPLIQKPEKDDINTSIIAIKRNIERINMLLGLVDNDSPDLSGFATKQELQDAVTELQPVDEVTVGNMHSVSSNAVARAIGGNEKKTYTFTFSFFQTQANTNFGYVKISLPAEITNNNIASVFIRTPSIASSRGTVISLIWVNGEDSYINYLSPYSIEDGVIYYGITITYII